MSLKTPAPSPETGSHTMLGHGFYNAHSASQHHANDLGRPFLERALAALDLPNVGAVSLADYGSSQGANSIAPMDLACARLRRRTKAPITVTHVDLPGNDFSALFELMQTAPESYLRHRDVFTLASGHSFYEVCLPAASVTLGYSAIATHWIRRLPCDVPDGIWGAVSTPRVKAAFAAQAAEDWRTFLECRAVELRPGGQMVLVLGSGDDANASGAEGLLDVADEALRRLIDQGRLSADEYGRMSLAMHFRTAAEWRAPFDPATKAGPGGLELVEDAYFDIEDALQTQFGKPTPSEGYAIAYRDFLRAFAERPLFAALDAHRGADERQSLSEAWSQLMTEAIMKDPARVVCHWHLGLMRLRRP